MNSAAPIGVRWNDWLASNELTEDEMDGTGTVGSNTQPVSMETLRKAMQEIELLPKPDQWIVIDPQGRMYKGPVEAVMPVLVHAHPLMRGLTSFERIDG